MGREEKWSLRENRGLEWARLEGLTQGMAAGPAAHFQRRLRMHGFLWPWPPPHGLCGLSLHKAGVWGLGPIHQVSFLGGKGVYPFPLTKICSLCKVPFWFFCC